MRKLITAILTLIICTLTFSNISAQQLTQQWGKKFGPVKSINGNTQYLYTGNIAVDENGNSYVIVEDNFFNSLIKFNSNGQVVWRNDSLNATTPPGMFTYFNLRYYRGNLYYSNLSGISKIDLNGNILWNWNAVDFQGGYYDEAQWTMDNAGNLIAAWQIQQWPQEFDSVQMIAKIDTAGNTLWSHQYTLSNSDTSFQNFYITCDSFNNIYLSYSVIFTLPPIPYTNAQWLTKVSPTGQILWSYGQQLDADQMTFTPIPHQDGSCWGLFPWGTSTKAYIFNSVGNLVTTNMFNGNYTPLLQKGLYWYYMHGNYLIKTDESLNILSQARIPGVYFENTYYDNNFIYVVTYDSTATKTQVYKYDYNCQLKQTLLPYYSNTAENQSNIGADTMGNVYILSSDWGDSAEVYKYCTNCTSNVNGIAYADTNQNCILDSNEAMIEGRVITVTPGPYYAVSDANGSFRFILPTGNYTMWPNMPQYWNATCADTTHFTIDSLNADTNILLASRPKPGVSDVQVQICATEAVVGYNQAFIIDYSNLGTTTDSGWVQANLGGQFHLENAVPAPDSMSGNSYFWKYDSLQPGQLNEIVISDFVPAYLWAYDVYQLTAFISPVTGDANPSNNFDTISGIVFSSFDPNLKTVKASNITSDGYLTDSSVLTYTVEFQNTGNDTAHKIVIIDTLNSNLDISTFTILQTTFKNYRLTLLPNNILQITFDNIILPDSGANLVLSQAFIKYSIRPLPNLQPGAVITNSAAIYFDFNPGLITNTTVNYYQQQPLGLINTSRYQQIIYAYPNPFNDEVKISLSNPTGKPTKATVYDLVGHLVFTQQFEYDRSMTIDRNQMSEGMYLLQISQDNKPIGIARIVVQ